MHSRWYSVAVVLLWLAAMTWLVREKVLPPLLVGDPPSFRTILEAERQRPPVGWILSFNGRELGWALSNTAPMPGGSTEVESRVHFDELPIADMTPGWAQALLQLIRRPSSNLQMDARSKLTIDALGRLTGFESKVRLEPLKGVIAVRAAVEGTQVSLSVQLGDVTYPETEMSLPGNGLLGDALSPQMQLPGLRLGQKWTVPSYNPLCPRDPLEILQASVDGIEPMTWDGKREHTWLVVYRPDSGSKLGADSAPRQRLWVRADGTVLKQQVSVLQSKMTFLRMSDEESVSLQQQVASSDAQRIKEQMKDDGVEMLIPAPSEN